ncbi:MAG: hypothetical protein ACLFRG_18340 [Desulfococcaceae bacterium]
MYHFAPDLELSTRKSANSLEGIETHCRCRWQEMPPNRKSANSLEGIETLPPWPDRRPMTIRKSANSLEGIETLQVRDLGEGFGDPANPRIPWKGLKLSSKSGKADTRRGGRKSANSLEGIETKEADVQAQIRNYPANPRIPWKGLKHEFRFHVQSFLGCPQIREFPGRD